MIFFITGIAGFIGSNLADDLLSDPQNFIIGIDNFDNFYAKEIKLKNIEGAKKFNNFIFFEGDIKNYFELVKIVKNFKIDQVIHLAGNAGVRPSILNPVKYIENNLIGTINILEICKNFQIPKLIFASSSSVYGEMKSLPFNEDMNLFQPISPYASSKLAGEHICYTYSHLYDINIIVLRFFTVYGMRQRPDLAIHKFCKLIHENKEIEMYGNGNTKRDYTFIEDIIMGICGAINYNKSKYEIFNLGGSRPIELSYLLKLIEFNLQKKALVKRCQTQIGDMICTYADISKSQKLLNYYPKTNIEDGINIFVKWFLINK